MILLLCRLFIGRLISKIQKVKEEYIYRLTVKDHLSQQMRSGGGRLYCHGPIVVVGRTVGIVAESSVVVVVAVVVAWRGTHVVPLQQVGPHLRPLGTKLDEHPRI